MAFASFYEGSQAQTDLPDFVNHLGHFDMKTWFLAITMKITIVLVSHIEYLQNIWQ